jgi:hypothetical protein
MIHEMHKLILVSVFLIQFFAGFGQKTLLLENIGIRTRYSFDLGDVIRIRTKQQNQYLKNYLWSIGDSSITVGPRTIVNLSDITAVYKHYHFPALMTKFFFIAGAGYFIVDSFNNLINREQVFIPQTMIISASLIGASAIYIPFHLRKCKLGLHWKLKIMDVPVR